MRTFDASSAARWRSGKLSSSYRASTCATPAETYEGGERQEGQQTAIPRLC